MEKLQGVYKIVSNEKVCPKFYRLCIDAKPIVKTARPGQFMHIRINDELEPFFRRPFSIYRANKHVEILYEVVGPGTHSLASKRKGDPIDVLGPAGTPFRMPPKSIKQVVMIAGGVGVAPFLFLSDHLKKKKYELTVLYGGRTKGHIFKMKAFKENGCRVFTATDDGSVGVKGRVSKLFSKIDPDPKTTFIYTCGPKPMMASVQNFIRKHDLRAEASCEEVMACGLGACLGCSIKTTKGFKTVCNDGPAFDLNELIFECVGAGFKPAPTGRTIMTLLLYVLIGLAAGFAGGALGLGGGAFLGAHVVQNIPGPQLKRIFGVFLVIVGIKMAFLK